MRCDTFPTLVSHCTPSVSGSPHLLIVPTERRCFPDNPPQELGYLASSPRTSFASIKNVVILQGHIWIPLLHGSSEVKHINPLISSPQQLWLREAIIRLLENSCG
eukprot:gb/GECG01013194.1/.p1 GENE.gb/GECG01013194.1/~~gb/GECG01013194.1/.p1  ORF type:complete len:105 (+),score=1.00 gb/GECG01013194.1/:1-315(+)